ncbi:Pkinase-domain-containing protein [Dendrothele bispora CBS 962.96]|uniref:Pkinase-domain-containing protein n=1 Tax=Dendrothele bispora (strain CBS 962.96) TaxID=1314807 RepID=A0A4V6T5R8_DENBC|nr:Pkinase-domain-containing protein [Dendrothele bispora CBS 962.96]
MRTSSPLSPSLSPMEHGTTTTSLFTSNIFRRILRSNPLATNTPRQSDYDNTTPTATTATSSTLTQLPVNTTHVRSESPDNFGPPRSVIGNNTLPTGTARPELHVNPRISGRQQSIIEPLKFQWIRGEKLGSGSFGKVYLALNATTGDIMAVKQVELLRTISGPTKHQQEMIDALKFESNTLKDLDHPHIVHYLGWEESPENLSIFMEYVSGGTINGCLSSHGPFHDFITRSFTTQILNGLEYLHSKGIIHRDLKADNILVATDGRCKISDFGISKHAEEDFGRAFTGMKGTIYWMAPEVVEIDKAKGYDLKVDIWSVGCVVLEMWSGKRPWFGQELYPVIFKLAKERSAPPIPKNVEVSDLGLDFRSKCFAKEAQMRPSAAELLQHPYLQLPPNWIFEGFDADQSRYTRGGEAPVHSKEPGRRRLGSTKNVPPVPPIPPPPVNPPPTTYPANPTITQARYDAASPSRPPPSAAGPPVVVIKPARPHPVSNNSSPWSPAETPSPSTSTSSARWSARRKKSFYVVNPDPDDYVPQGRNKFFYSPPPLPSVPGPSRLSVGMAPRRVSSSLTLHKHAVPRRAPSTPALRSSGYQSMALSASSSSTSSSTFNNAFTTTTITDYTDSDSDSDDGLWNRPPVPTLTREELGDNSRKRASRISKIGTKRDSAWERPPAEDIYQNIGKCFPGHDIDKPIIQNEPPLDPLRRGGTITRAKTLREVGQERVNDSGHPGRRVTRLWGLQTEEVIT